MPNPSTIAFDDEANDSAEEIRSRCCHAPVALVEEFFVCGGCGEPCDIRVLQVGHC